MIKTKYSKPFMSITDLVQETGLSRDYFKRLSRIENAPIVRTLGGGKIFFDTSKLDDFMEEVSKRIERGTR